MNKLKKGEINLPVVLLSILFIIAIGLFIFILFYVLSPERDDLNQLGNLTMIEIIDDATQHNISLTDQQPSCSDECPARGLKKCSNNGYKICGDFDRDDCYEWSSSIKCDSDERCRSGRCIEIGGGEPTPEPDSGYVRYDFDDIEILSAESFNITPIIGVESDTWADELRGSSKKLTATYSVFNLKRDGQVVIEDEEFLKIEGPNGMKRFLVTHKSYNGDEERSFFWSAKQIQGDWLIKNFTLPIYSTSLLKKIDESGEVYRILLSFSDDGLNVDEESKVYSYEMKEVEPSLPEKTCSELNGSICSEYAINTCKGQWLESNDSNRCCSIECTNLPICVENPETGKINVCTCEPNQNKNKLAIVIKENGDFDNNEISQSINDYFASVKKDLNIDNVGIKKFSGKNSQELDSFLENLYNQQNVGYVTIVGDSLTQLIISADNFDTLKEFEIVGGEFDPERCTDISISYILPPYLDVSENNKREFIINIFENFTSFHNNPDNVLSKYINKALLMSEDDENESRFEIIDKDRDNILRFIDEKIIFFGGYLNIPYHEEIPIELKKNYVTLSLFAHAFTGGILVPVRQVEIFDEVENYTFVYNETLSLDIWKNWSEEKPLSLFVAVQGCEVFMSDEGEIIGWPQTMLESKVLAYAAGAGFEIILKLPKYQTVGDNQRGEPHSQSIIFGDIMAHT